MMLMAAYAASVGGIATPVGTPPNLIGIGMIEKLVKVKIPFFQWMLFAVPMHDAHVRVLYVILYCLYKPEVASIEGSREFVQGELQQLGAWSRGEKNALIAFLITVALWVTPGFLAVFFGTS